MSTPPPSLGGFTDDLADAGKWILNNVVPIAEVVVPVIAPEAAPIVAAEHALRTGQSLSHDQAKAATVAATKVGKAVAASQGVESTTSSELMTPEPKKNGGTSGWLVVGALALAAYLLSR
ncbi:MAG TPA: hypothetical protein VLZ09_00475 [Gaiellaceae bacterium]|nr:hypothetical protein [Gaiellaceae bacterium]